MTDLLSWLRSAVDEHERIALRAHPADIPWIRSQIVLTAEAGTDVFDALVAVADPAHVLRTVAAHREILDRHKPRNVMNNDGVRVIGVECSWCVIPNDGYLTTMREDWPCPDVRSLAAIYRDQHPGFAPSWIGES